MSNVVRRGVETGTAEVDLVEGGNSGVSAMGRGLTDLASMTQYEVTISSRRSEGTHLSLPMLVLHILHEFQ